VGALGVTGGAKNGNEYELEFEDDSQNEYDSRFREEHD
jgi:hypothetical protein